MDTISTYIMKLLVSKLFLQCTYTVSHYSAAKKTHLKTHNLLTSDKRKLNKTVAVTHLLQLHYVNKSTNYS